MLAHVFSSNKSVKTAVPDDGRPPGALVLTKLVGWYRFKVGQKKVKKILFVSDLKPIPLD